jgi:tetratricopeptide (TPR) repeat protein
MNPPAGSLIAFSTDAGRTASDGEGANGTYTAELIKHLRTPGLTIGQVFKRTRAGVIARSGGAQIPAEYSRLVGDDIFLAGKEAPKDPEEVIPKGRPIPLPALAEINKLAAQGDADKCVHALRQHIRAGSSLNAAAPLGLLLESIKESLRDPKAAAPRAEAILKSCEITLAALGDCLPADHSQRAVLTAKAHNRRGDALLLLGKSTEALDAFNAALALTPDDAYVLYNRGMALLRLERPEEARADFTKVASAKTKQPGARRLASEALATME